MHFFLPCVFHFFATTFVPFRSIIVYGSSSNLVVNLFLFLCLKSLPLNGGPLSDLTVCGMPCRAKIASNLGMRVLTDVLLIISVSGYREYLSIRTIIYWPVGSGP